MKRALYRLELATPADESDLHPHLVRLLGSIDGVLLPGRFAGDQSRYTAEVLSQRDYLNGISYSAETSDDTSQQASWKRSERVRSAMAAAGWITIANAKCKLTMAGDVLARSLVGQASLNDIVPRAIFELLKRATSDRSNGWISEISLFGIDSQSTDDYQSVSEMMLPLIQFGYVECCSSTVARIFYRPLVDELPAKVDVQIGQYDADLSQVYTDSFCMAIKQRCNRDVGSELVIPLGAT